MSKFNTSNINPTGNLQKAALPELPVTPQDDVQRDLQIDLLNIFNSPESIPQHMPTVEEEEQRQSVPTIRERYMGDERFDRWMEEPIPPIDPNNDGGMVHRAKTLAHNSMAGKISPVTSISGTAGRPVQDAGGNNIEIADAIEETSPGLFSGVIQRLDANAISEETKAPIPDPLLSQLISFRAENFFAAPSEANLLPGETTEEPKGESSPTTLAQGNERLGQEIALDYQRMRIANNAPTDLTQQSPQPQKLSREQAETLGAVAKDLWYRSNPNLMNRVVDPKTKQAIYVLTSEGQSVIERSALARKRMFPLNVVRPSKIPPQKNKLLGDTGRNIARKVLGKVGDQSFGDTLTTAAENLSSLPHVVNKQRAKILLSSSIPFLQLAQSLDDYSASWQAEALGFGESKITSFKGKAANLQRRVHSGDLSASEVDYNVQEVHNSLVSKVAQEIRSVAMERHGVNYLTFSIMGYNGRLQPQQTYYNPTTSKIVRFVDANPVPAVVKKNSRTYHNLRQMYALTLVDSAGKKLPNIREAMLDSNANRLETWGKRLTELLNNVSDDQYEKVADAIEKGMPIDDPAFPKITPLALDPQEDSDLIKAIVDRGDDGFAFIDGLIDFAAFSEAMRNDRPYHSFFNAYIDGKTNGPATIGMQLGNTEYAKRTGVTREGNEDILEIGDLRDQISGIAIESLDSGWEGDTYEFEQELNAVSRSLFSSKELNKPALTVIGYGSNTNSMTVKTILEDVIGLLSETNPVFKDNLDTVLKYRSVDDLIQAIMGEKYSPAIMKALSADAIEILNLSRSTAMLHALMDELMTVTSPIGQDLMFGGNTSLGYESASKTNVSIFEGDSKSRSTLTVAHYENRPSSSATKSLDGRYIPGRKAYGQALPGLVQSVDAATVAKTFSGKSWSSLKGISKNVYLYPIYDAFKMDANSYDMTLQEVNLNWLNINRDWNMIKSMRNGAREKYNQYKNNQSVQDPNASASDNSNSVVQTLFQKDMRDNLKVLTGLYMNLLNSNNFGSDKDQLNFITKQIKILKSEMKKVNLDIDNPPDHITNKQLDKFISVFLSSINYQKRLETLINKIEVNKKGLASEISKRGYKNHRGITIPLQYSDH